MTATRPVRRSRISIRRVPDAAAQKIRDEAAVLHRVELAFHAVGLVVIGILFVMALSALGTANVATCALHGTLDQQRGLVLAAVTVGGAVVGRLTGWFRFHVREGLYGPDRALPTPVTYLNAALILFLAAAALLLGYETWAVANGGSPPPITSYVRCAAYHQPFLSAILAGAVGFVLSNWLWFPTK